MMHDADFSTFLFRLEKIICYFKLFLYLCGVIGQQLKSLYNGTEYLLPGQMDDLFFPEMPQGFSFPQ